VHATAQVTVENSVPAMSTAVAGPAPVDAISQILEAAAGSLAWLVPSDIRPIIEALEAITLPLAAVSLPILAVEIVWLWWRGALGRVRIAGMATGFFCVVPATAIQVLLGAGLVTLFLIAGAVSPFAIPVTWWTAALCLLLADLAYYIEHRLAHRVNLLWSLYHVVHHSAGHYDQSVAYRVSFADFFFSPLFYLPLVLAGFDPVLVLTCFAIVLAYQTWLHTELVGKLSWLDPWLNSPSNHRVHHGTQAAYLDKNFGGILIIWDRLFGSYQAEIEAPNYGIIDPLRTANPIAVHGREAWRLARGLRRAATVRGALRTAFGPPGA